MNEKQQHYVSIGYGSGMPSHIIPFDDNATAKATAVFLAENLQGGMYVRVGGVQLPSAAPVPFDTYRELFAGMRVGKYRNLPTGDDAVCDDNFCRNEPTVQIELEGAYWELCYDHHQTLIKETGAILRHVDSGWDIDQE